MKHKSSIFGNSTLYLRDLGDRCNRVCMYLSYVSALSLMIFFLVAYSAIMVDRECVAAVVSNAGIWRVPVNNSGGRE